MPLEVGAQSATGNRAISMKRRRETTIDRPCAAKLTQIGHAREPRRQLFDLSENGAGEAIRTPDPNLGKGGQTGIAGFT